MHVRFPEPVKAVTPEQAFVMYDGDVCLGSALVRHSGPTMHETQAEMNWDGDEHADRSVQSAE